MSYKKALLNGGHIASVVQVAVGARVAPDGSAVLACSVFTGFPADGRPLIPVSETLSEGGPIRYIDASYGNNLLLTADGRPVFAVYVVDANGAAAVLGGGTGGGGSLGTPPTLQIFNGSTYGTNADAVADPPLLKHALTDAGQGEGDWIVMEIDAVSSASNGDGSYNSGSTDYRTQTRVLLWDGTLNAGAGGYQLADPGTFVPGDFTIQSGLLPTKEYKAHTETQRNLGDTILHSGWNAGVTFDVASPGVTIQWSATDHSTWESAPVMSITDSDGSGTLDRMSSFKSGANEAIRGSAALPAGSDIYLEYELTVVTSGSDNRVGFATNAYGNSTTGALSTVGDSGANLDQTIVMQGTTLKQGTTTIATPFGVFTAANGDVIGFAIKQSIGKFWVRRNGAWPAGHDPVTNAGGYAIPWAVPLKPLAIHFKGSAATETTTIRPLATVASNAPAGLIPAGS